jgi:drug/metabolite transporter (DMT)-like permease
MGLVFGILAALFYGAASVFQAIAAKRAPTSAIKAFMQPTFLVGLALDGAGFVVQFLALRTLPIFVVQACLAASLAVTAILAIPMLKLRLGRVEWLAIAAVCVGLALLGISAGRESVDRPSSAFRIGLLVAVPVLAILGAIAYKLPGRARAISLGLVGGLCFGLVALAARALSEVSFPQFFAEPELYALIIAGILAFVFYTLGLQRASVTTVTAGLVIGETVLPSVVGIVALGDSTRSGFIPVAIVGFVIAIAASLMLARYGSLEEEEPERVAAR